MSPDDRLIFWTMGVVFLLTAAGAVVRRQWLGRAALFAVAGGAVGVAAVVLILWEDVLLGWIRMLVPVAWQFDATRFVQHTLLNVAILLVTIAAFAGRRQPAWASADDD
jgi:hypothetical protein